MAGLPESLLGVLQDERMVAKVSNLSPIPHQRSTEGNNHTFQHGNAHLQLNSSGKRTRAEETTVKQKPKEGSSINSIQRTDTVCSYKNQRMSTPGILLRQSSMKKKNQHRRRRRTMAPPIESPPTIQKESRSATNLIMGLSHPHPIPRMHTEGVRKCQPTAQQEGHLDALSNNE